MVEHSCTPLLVASNLEALRQKVSELECARIALLQQQIRLGTNGLDGSGGRLNAHVRAAGGNWEVGWW